MFSFCDFVVLMRRCFVCRLCATLFVFFLLFRVCSVQVVRSASIQPMTLASSTLQIRRHCYSGDFNIVIFVGLYNLTFYAINMDDVSLFTYSSFLFLANLYFIDVLYQFEWMNIICFISKKKFIKHLYQIYLIYIKINWFSTHKFNLI